MKYNEAIFGGSTVIALGTICLIADRFFLPGMAAIIGGIIALMIGLKKIYGLTKVGYILVIAGAILTVAFLKGHAPSLEGISDCSVMLGVPMFVVGVLILISRLTGFLFLIYIIAGALALYSFGIVTCAAIMVIALFTTLLINGGKA